MFDKLIDRHKNPLNILLHLLGMVAGVWGLWTHNWTIISLAIALVIIGHLFPYKK